MDRTHGVALAAGAMLALAVAACSTVSYTQDFDRQMPVRAAGTWAWAPLPASQEQALAAINPFLQRRIERAVERELDELGFALVSDAPSDYVVSAYPILPDRRARRASATGRRSSAKVSVGVGFGIGRTFGWGRPYGFGRWGYGWWPGFSFWSPYPWSVGMGWYWGGPYFGWPRFGGMPGFGYGVVSLGGYGRPSVIGSGDRGPGTLVLEVMETASGKIVWQGLADGALVDMPPAEELDKYIDGVVSRMLEGFPPSGGE